MRENLIHVHGACECANFKERDTIREKVEESETKLREENLEDRQDQDQKRGEDTKAVYFTGQAIP